VSEKDFFKKIILARLVPSQKLASKFAKICQNNLELKIFFPATCLGDSK